MVPSGADKVHIHYLHMWPISEVPRAACFFGRWKVLLTLLCRSIFADAVYMHHAWKSWVHLSCEGRSLRLWCTDDREQANRENSHKIADRYPQETKEGVTIDSSLSYSIVDESVSRVCERHKLWKVLRDMNTPTKSTRTLSSSTATLRHLNRVPSSLMF